MDSESMAALEIFGKNVSLVLEQMAFMFADPAEADSVSLNGGEIYLVQMSYLGPQRGTVIVATHADLGREIACNMLGVEPEEVTGKMVGDALKELLNMSCGQFLTTHYGQGPVFDLTVPLITRIDAGHWKQLASQPGSRLYQVDDYQLVVSIETAKSD